MGLPIDLEGRQALPALLAVLAPTLLFVLYIHGSNASPLFKLFMATALLYTSLKSCLAYTTGLPASDFFYSSSCLFYLFTALDRFVVSDLEKDFAPVGTKTPPCGWSWARAVWAFKLLCSTRGAGWTWEVRGTPRLSLRHSTRLRYLLSRITRLVFCYLIFDFATYATMNYPFFAGDISFNSLSFAKRVFVLLVAGTSSVTGLFLINNIICVLSVATGVWRPDECRELFGSPKSARTIAGFWGSTWHQCLRRVLSSPSRAIIRASGITPSSYVTRLTALTTTFALSAFLHSFSLFCVNGTGINVALFFLLQPIGIIIEEAAQIKRFGSLGYVWTLAWIMVTAPLFVNGLTKLVTSVLAPSISFLADWRAFTVELEQYEYQLSQVKLALAKDPTNPEYISLRDELSSLIELTKEYLAASGASTTTSAANNSTSTANPSASTSAARKGATDSPRSQPSTSEQPGKGKNATSLGASTPTVALNLKAGDDCQARYSGDGKFYPARITSVGGSDQNRVFSVIFQGYDSTEIVPAADIKTLSDSKKRMVQAATEDELEKERKRKKSEKKADNRAVKIAEQGERQKSWQSFGKKVSKKPGGSKVVPGLSGQSMFRSPDDGNPNARVGVVGSGKGMSAASERKRQTFKEFAE